MPESDSAGSIPVHIEWIKGPGDLRFYTRLFPSPRPHAAVLFVHGFMEHSGRYEAVFPIWAARGISVFAFDQRGFGRTCFNGDAPTTTLFGKTSGVDQVRDIEFFLMDMPRRFPGIPIFLMGFSMGGGRVLHFVTRTSHPAAARLISGVIAYAPHVNESNPVSKWVRVMGGLVETIAPYTTFHTNAKPENLSHNVVTNQAWAQDPLIKTQGTLRGLGDLLKDGEELLAKGYKDWPETLPVIFLHGTDDPVTCPIASKQFHDKICGKDKTYVSFPNSFHELHNEPDARDRFHETCIAWIEAHIDQT